MNTQKELEIIDLRENYSKSLLEDFITLCEVSFLWEKRDELNQWKLRIQNLYPRPPEPRFHIFLIGHNLMKSRRKRILGGCTLEIYKESLCGLLGNLVIVPDHRRKGIAKRLIKTVLDSIKSEASEDQIQAVFARATDPRTVDPKGDLYQDYVNIEILSRIGLRLIDIPFFKPKRQKKPSTPSKALFIFKQTDNFRGEIPTKIISNFLNEYYRACKYKDSVKDFEKMLSALKDDYIEIKEILVERPTLYLKNASISLHILSKRDEEIEKNRKQELRQPFRSFELDMLSYYFQQRQPIHSVCDSKEPTTFKIEFPSSLEYHSCPFGKRAEAKKKFF